MIKKKKFNRLTSGSKTTFFWPYVTLQGGKGDSGFCYEELWRGGGGLK